MVINISDHPVCAAEVASQLFLIAQPPLLWRRGLAAACPLFPFWATLDPHSRDSFLKMEMPLLDSRH